MISLRQFKINFQHPIRGTYHDVFTGYVENWDYKRVGPRGAVVTARLVDMMALLAQADVNSTLTGAPFGSAYAAQHWDDRIKAALGDAGVPSSYFFVTTGNINCQGNAYTSGSKVLEVILDAVQAEMVGVSNCYVDPTGKFKATGRFIRGIDGTDPVDVYGPDTAYASENLTQRWRVGDAAACALDPTLLPIADLTWARGKEAILNALLITPEGASKEALATNYVASGASITKYGRQANAFTGLLILDADNTNSGLQETKMMADYLIGNYADPHDRITSIEFHGQMDDGQTEPGGASGNLWDFILGVDINHIIEVTTYNPPGQLLGDGSVDTSGGGFNAVEFFVESVSNDVSRLNDRTPDWKMTLGLSLRPKIKKVSGTTVVNW